MQDTNHAAGAARKSLMFISLCATLAVLGTARQDPPQPVPIQEFKFSPENLPKGVSEADAMPIGQASGKHIAADDLKRFEDLHREAAALAANLAPAHASFRKALEQDKSFSSFANDYKAAVENRDPKDPNSNIDKVQGLFETYRDMFQRAFSTANIDPELVRRSAGLLTI